MSTRCQNCGSMFTSMDMCKSCKRPINVARPDLYSGYRKDYIDDEIGRIDFEEQEIVKELTHVR